MNYTSQLRATINDAKAHLAQHQGDEDFLGELAGASYASLIEELETKLHHELALREREVVEIHLEGKSANWGTIPLQLLGRLATAFSDGVHCASHFLRNGVIGHGAIPKEIRNTINLRLAGLASGSTRVFVTGDVAPDLFGYSLLADSLDHTFDLLHAETPEQMVQSVSEIGARSSRKYRDFLAELRRHELTADISWATPEGKLRQWPGDDAKIAQLVNALDDLTTVQPQKIQFSGQVVTISSRETFEILGAGGTLYRGRFPSALLGVAEQLHIHQKVSGLIEKTTLVNKTTGTEKHSYRLLHVDGIDPKTRAMV